MSNTSKRVTDLTQLIPDENFVGAVIQQDYEQMLIATTDYLQINSGGVPKNCFLTVAAHDEEGGVSEVVLVSVQGPVPMQTQRELLAVREELANTLTQGIQPTRNDTLDVKLSTQALSCKILGSFYKNEEGKIQFGSDVDNIRSSASLRVYRPTGKAMSFIASFSTRSQNAEAMLEVGKVRYTETRKKIDEDAAVYVNVEDLLATKTALFGMTRSGKALERSTRIPVPVSAKFPDGWARNEDLEVGDLVFSSTGCPVPIVAFTDWKEETVYEVEFEDGQKVKTAGSHLWKVRDLSALSGDGGDTTPTDDQLDEGRIKRTMDKFDNTTYAPISLISEVSGVSEQALLDLAQESRLQEELARKAGEFGGTEDAYPVKELLSLALEYLIHHKNSLPTKIVTTDFINRNLNLPTGSPRWAVDLYDAASSNVDDIDADIDFYDFGVQLIDSNKTVIPAEYMRASYDQRLELLQGIVDSKGPFRGGEVAKLSIKSKTLALQVLEIIRSLGMKGQMTPMGADFYAHNELIHSVPAMNSITFSVDAGTGESEHNNAYYQRSLTQPWNAIVSVREIGMGDTRCLTVDSPDSLHLVEGFIPTHNSNTTKVLLQKIHQFTHERGKPVAQLIMDPQGEYANSNSQDGSALANIGDESQVAIYKMMEKRSNPKEKFLQFNLFAEENLALTYDLILAELRNGISADANYIAPLFSQEFEPLGENATVQQRIHHARKKLGIFALMYEGIKNYPVKPFSVSLPEAVLESIREDKIDVEFSSYKANEVLIRSTGDAWRVANVLLEKKATNDLNESWNNEFNEGDGGVFLEQLFQIKEKGRNGVKGAIARIEPLHSIDAEGDVRDNVWQDIQAGKLIVVDLSRGSMETSRALSELIVNYLLAQASERFVSGLDPVPFQIVVEEAHNLFDRESRKGESDPWVRISKEAAKYHIGLVYATQEISSVDRRILSNTSNFVISALSSSKEIAELGNYYSFGDWADHIKRIETKGFVRLKTQSSPFIIPVQMEKFEVESMSAVSSKHTPVNPASTDVESARDEPRPSAEFAPSDTADNFDIPSSGNFDELEF